MPFFDRNPFGLDKTKYSWYARNIQFPIIVYLAKRAFKHNRLDTFTKWIKRLPNQLHFVLNPKTKDTFHHYLAKQTFSKHLQANQKIRAKKKIRSYWPIAWLMVVIGNFQRQRRIKIRNRHRAEAVFYIQFFLKLTYSPEFESLHPTLTSPQNRLSNEWVDTLVEKIEEAVVSGKTPEEIRILSMPLLANGTRLQKAKTALKLFGHAKKAVHFVNAALHEHGQKNQQKQTPESIFFRIFSKEVPNKSTLKSKTVDLGLVSKESSQQLSPYEMILREIKKYVTQDIDVKPASVSSSPTDESQNQAYNAAFEGWLFPQALEVNLMQQDHQDESIEQQQTQEQQVEVHAALADEIQIAPQAVQKTEMVFIVRIDKAGQIVGFIYQNPNMGNTTLNQAAKDYFALPHASQPLLNDAHGALIRDEQHFGKNLFLDAQGNLVRKREGGTFSPIRAQHEGRIQQWLQSFITQAMKDHKEVFDHVIHIDNQQAFVIRFDHALLNAMDYQDALRVLENEIVFTKKASMWSCRKPMMHMIENAPETKRLRLLASMSTALAQTNLGLKTFAGVNKKEIEAAERGEVYDLVMTVCQKRAAPLQATAPTQINIDAYPFLTAEMKAWLNAQIFNAEHETAYKKITTHAIEEHSPDDPFYDFKFLNKSDIEIVDKSFGGRQKLSQVIQHLLRQHHLIGDEKLNQLLLRLQKLDEAMMVCRPLLGESDHYSVLSFFNDYVFQNMLHGSNEFGLQALCDFLVSDLFKVMSDELLSQDETLYSSLFGLVFYAWAPLQMIVLSASAVATKPTLSIVVSGVSGQSLMNQYLPLFLNNYRYLKKNNLWSQCAHLSKLGSDVVHVLRDQYDARKNPVVLTQHEKLFLMMFYMDLTQRAPFEIEDMLQAIESPVLNKDGARFDPTLPLTSKRNRTRVKDNHQFQSFTFPNPFLVDFDCYRDKPEKVTATAFDGITDLSFSNIKRQFFTVINHFPRHCRYGEIRAFVEALEPYAQKPQALFVIHQVMRLMVRYVQNPAIQTEPLFWKKLLEHYQSKLNAATFDETFKEQLKKDINAEIAMHDLGNFSMLEGYVKSAAVAAQQGREQLPIAGMDAFMWLTVHGELDDAQISTAMDLLNTLEERAHAQNQRKKDKRTLQQRAVDFHAIVEKLKEVLPFDVQQALYRVEFEEAYESFKVTRSSQTEAVKLGKISQTVATENITKAGETLERSKAFQWLSRHMDEKNAEVQLQKNRFETLRASCHETKNLSIEGLKQYIKDNGLYDVKTAVNEKQQYQFLAAMIRMLELCGVGVPTQPQLYVALDHLQRLREYNPNEESVVLYRLFTGEGKTLMQHMTGFLDKLFQIRADHMTTDRDLAKTGAIQIQKLAQEFFGIQVRDLYRQTEQEAFTEDAPKADSLEAFQRKTLAESDIVYIDVYDNMLQMAKAIHLHEGPRAGVGREAANTHLSVDEVDHLLEVSAKVTAHIAEIEKDPNKLLMLKDFYRALNETMAALLSKEILPQLQACANSDKKREFTKKLLLNKAQGKPEVIQYIESLSEILFDGWVSSALTVHTRLKHERNRFYTFETEKRDGKDVQVLYLALKDTNGKVIRDAQWSAGVHQLLSDYWLKEQQEKRDTTTTSYWIPPLSHTVLHTSVELLVQPYHFITGVTATLGSQADMKTLKAVFPGKKIREVYLPRSTPSRRFDFAPLVVLKEQVLAKKYEILREAMAQKEPLLIRFETIQEVEDFQAYCLKRNPNMVPYLLDDKRRLDTPVNAALVIRQLADGGVGVITNAGSRGVDFKNIKRLSTRLAGTRGTQQIKGRSARFGEFGITQDMVTVEELGLTIRVFPPKQQRKLSKPIKQGNFENTAHFQERLNKQRLEQQRAHVQLIKQGMALKQSTEKKKKVKAKDISLLDEKTKHITFVTSRVESAQQRIDARINTECSLKMRNNFLIDAIQSAVMPVLHQKPVNDLMRVEWRQSCLPAVQSQIRRGQTDEAIAVFQHFAEKYQLDATKALGQIQKLRMDESSAPRLEMRVTP